MLKSLGLLLLLACAWLLLHRYQGLDQDARIYALQALARLQPNLGDDLYLQNTSQDRFTVFSPLYAQVIRFAGLRHAALSLMILFTISFLSAAWYVARVLVGSEHAWISVATLVATVGAYGANGVFHFSEDYLTARSMAEAMVVTSLLIFLRGRRVWAIFVGVAALSIHPIMALPGVLLLIFLLMPAATAVVLSGAGVVIALIVALAAEQLPGVRQLLPLLDPPWLDVVRERSQFLFVQLWSVKDWELNLRPIATLTLAALVFGDSRVSKLCLVACLIGIAGLCVATIASNLGPVALMMQGQAWRWIWIAAFLSALLVLPTAIRLWQAEPCGPLCSVLLVTSWSIASFDAPLLAFAALTLCALGNRVPLHAQNYLRTAAVILAAALFIWLIVKFGAACLATAGAANLLAVPTRADAIAYLRPLLLTLVVTGGFALLKSRTVRVPGLISLGLAGCLPFLVPLAFDKADAAASPQSVEEFADWRTAIPPSSSIYVANGHDSGSFAWFTLGRPSYLSMDQSAGVVFSRDTALEVKRRSTVLLPLMNEDWKLLTKNRLIRQVGTRAATRWTSLTSSSLIAMCADPQLGFLAARADVGFAPLRHERTGPWKDWNLYDCASVRTEYAP